MRVYKNYNKNVFLRKGMEYLCTGIMTVLCILWGVILTALYLLILFAVTCVRIFEPDD
ncbi:hypothetical protein NE689_10760 [Lactonifactor longoviformis]|uniref:hypothetical protein n=1 Tax=Lactonifactor TaxID=420345 RepID=UPI0012AF2421|nr:MULTISPECIES: hypothetical protein [Lactonifactor]MCB5714851.1 hypothetical protein [Lactonifactor longoviformis]MCB5718805.1 hypothetical protein [Lactonifactor longoviformis]MCQ4671799.1 hypothetical protein [Lactonifactor longoviformis]MSA02560.1 hypothetical protein [Lactonifactor sp. BIOML-A5]MSA08926.1 hypothetical protein [Lactonifactor sp. BIOML-A4]